VEVPKFGTGASRCFENVLPVDQTAGSFVGTSADLPNHGLETAETSGHKPTSAATSAGTRASVLGVLLSFQRKLL